MKAGFILLLVFFYYQSFGQTGPKPIPPPVPVTVKSENHEMKPAIPQVIIDFPDVEAIFPGGEDVMKEWIKNNIEYPAESIKNNEQGKVYVSFLVGSDGKISQVIIERGVSINLDREAKRVVRNMPSWIPGEYEGKKVTTRVRLPFVFSL